MDKRGKKEGREREEKEERGGGKKRERQTKRKEKYSIFVYPLNNKTHWLLVFQSGWLPWSQTS